MGLTCKCGGTPKIVPSGLKGWRKVECPKCFASSGVRSTDELVIADWEKLQGDLG